MTRRTLSRPIAAASGQVWTVLAAYGDISAWAPGVDHSCLLRAVGDRQVAGVGLVRRNQVGRLTVLERVTAWEEPEHLGYTIEGLPQVVKRAANDWTLEELDDGTTLVTVTSTVDCGARPPQELVSRVIAARLATTSKAMLDGLADHLTATGERP